MKFLGFLAAATMTGICLASAGASPEYVLTIENPGTANYRVVVQDQTRSHDVIIAAGKSASWTLASQTPQVTVTTAGCSGSARPSIKTYVTLRLLAHCKIETKAAGISGF